MRLLSDWLRRGAHTISPTAHYTGYVWARHGLGDARLATREGRLFWALGQVAMVPSALAGGPTLEHFLLARHRILDLMLAEEIEAGRVGSVVELAAGMSPRGLSLTSAYAGLRYVEVDLPGMAERKQQALARLGVSGERHTVVAADVMSPGGLESVLAGLDHTRGVAVVTEGLLNYFPTSAVEALAHRIAVGLRDFPGGLYLSDLHLRAGTNLVDQAFAAGLGVAVRGRVHFHYGSAATAEQALLGAGFSSARLHAPAEYADRLPGMTDPGAGRVRIVEARTRA